MLRKSSTLFLLLLVLVAVAAPALAHADLLSTDPADGPVLSVPVERIEMVFTDQVESTSDGIRLLDADRNAVAASVFQPTESTVVIEPEAALPGGGYVVAWEVRTADSHVVSGSISFAIELPVAPAHDGEEGIPSEAAAVTTTSAPPATVPASDPPEAVRIAPNASQQPIEPNVVGDDPAVGTWLGRIGRWAAMTGALLAIGAFAFAATSLVGTEAEVRGAVSWVRRGAVLVLVGTFVEFAAMSLVLAGSARGAISASGLMDVLGGQFGVAVLLRLVGGIMMLQDPRLVTVSLGPPVADASKLPDVLGLGQSSGSQVAAATLPRAYRLEVQHEWVAITGMAAVAVSFVLVGHTVTADAGLIARAATLVHVVFAGVWLGGVVVMANTLTRRFRAAVPIGAAAMAVRFSRVAAASLVLVALAGLALTWAIIDTPSDLIASSWGRVLLVKVALVAIAAALGAYNHFQVVPRLDQDRGATGSSDLLRRVVRIEGIVLLFVVAVTAILVGAAI